MSTEIAIVVSPRDWAERLHRFVADHGGARVRARVLDAREAVDEGYRVLVAEDLTSFLTPRLLDELRRRGKAVLGIFDPTEPWGRQRLLELGVDEVLAATASPDEVLRTIDALAVTVGSDLDAELAELADLTGAPVRRRQPPPPPVVRHGRLTVVGGPAGGPGATEVALALATAVRVRGESVVLVDADDVAPSLAQRVGVGLHPNVRSLIDSVQHRSGSLGASLVALAETGVEVVAGLPNARDWGEVRPGELVDALRLLLEHREHVVANVGHRLEELGGAGGGSRYGLSRAVVEAADGVVAVGSPTPVGLARLLDWIADVRAIGRAPVAVAFDRVGKGTFRRAELERELRRTYSPPALHFLPEDHRVADAAWAGRLVTGGTFHRAVQALADEVVPRAASSPAVHA